MLLTLLTLVWTTLSAQITVTSSAIPNVGDTIRTSLDTNGIVDLVGMGGPKTWSYLNLQNHRPTTRVYQAANTGINFASYPGSDLLVVGQNGSETYYDRTNSQLAVLGYAGPDPANLGVAVLAHFSPPLILQRAPINFFDVNQMTSNLTIALSLNDIPDSLFTLPIPGVDSIRVRFTTLRLDVVDGYGTLSIPGQTEQVLREKRTETSTTGLDIHSFLGWTALPTGGGGIPGAGFLGTDTTISYRFYANNVKEELASVQLGPDFVTPARVSFKRNATSAINEVNADNVVGSVHAYPNPAVDEVNFECRNLQPGTYALKIYNLLGKTVWSKEYLIAGTKSIKVDLDDMRKGTYLYSLSDQHGTVISTKRLVIIKP
jgi:Secretion system C-terminal sorting domain